MRPAGDDARRPCILIVDDDHPTLKMLAELFESEGFSVELCRAPDEGLAYIRRRGPDVVLLDVWLGGTRAGWDLLERLKNGEATKDIPVIVSSADLWTLRNHVGLIDQYGVRAVGKPFDLGELVRAVREALDGSNDGHAP